LSDSPSIAPEHFEVLKEGAINTAHVAWKSKLPAVKSQSPLIAAEHFEELKEVVIIIAHIA
jgi:hypothetical protein